MSPVNGFQSDAHNLVHDDLSVTRDRCERRDRNFVRRALGRGVPAEDIEDRLLRTTEFHRLNPDRDPIHYVRGLIDEEGSDFRNLNPTEALAAHSNVNPSSPAKRPHAAGEQHAFQSETMARSYIQENFEPTDWLAVVIRNRGTGDTVQRITTAKQIASHEFQSWLRHKNAQGSDVYLSLNTLKEHAHGRTKADLKDIRHLYLDLDEGGQRKLATIYQDASVPHPNYVLQTSPGKYQVVWRVDGIAQKDAEDLLRGLSRRFGGDPAATDTTRVFRLPGFNNKKYKQNYPVKLAPGTLPEPVYRQWNFRIEPISRESGTDVLANIPIASESSNTQSERDWAYAVHHLRHGDNPQDIVREIAAYRATDRYDLQNSSIVASSKKPNPRYYAEHTVSRAMAYLGMTTLRSAKESKSHEIEPDR